MLKMKNRTVLLLGIGIMSLLLFVGCTTDRGSDRKTIHDGDKKITIIADANYQVGDDIVNHIEKYQAVKGYDFLEADAILGFTVDPSINQETQPYIHSLTTLLKSKKRAENLPDQMIHVSPNKKYVFFVDQVRLVGFIFDLEGKVIAKATGPSVWELSQAMWIDSEGLIMPSQGTGFYMIDTEGTETKIENVSEAGNISKAVRVGEKIYYETQFDLKREMHVYDLKTGESHLFVEDRVINFNLSPLQDRFIIQTQEMEEDKTVLTQIDLEGQNRETIAEGKMIYGLGWSPDGSKIVYALNSRQESDEGIFLIDLENKKKSQISTEFLNLESSIKWNLKGDKLLILNGEVVYGRWIDKMNIITLK